MQFVTTVRSAIIPVSYTHLCQMNARDSEKLVGILEQIGYVEGTDEHSDFIEERSPQIIVGLLYTSNLDSKKDWINELNVFPVPDGDTGTNMTMTIMSRCV